MTQTKLDTAEETKKLPKDGEVDSSKIEHEGYLEKIAFAGKGDWCVCKVENLTCTGTLHQREMGGRYKLYGKMVFSAKYNSWQFQFDRYEQLSDSSRRGIVNFLVNNAQGLGSVKAERIFAAFGAESLDIAINEPDRIAGRIDGISPDLALSIAKQLKANQYQASISTKLYAIGLTQYFVGVLLKNFGHRAEEELKNRCFELTRIHGIGFKRACDVADKLGIPKDNPKRIKAGIGYALKTKQQMEGHCCLERDDLLREAHDILKVDMDKISRYLDEMLQDSHLATENTDRATLVVAHEKRTFQKQQEQVKIEQERLNPNLEQLNSFEGLSELDFQGE